MMKLQQTFHSIQEALELGGPFRVAPDLNKDLTLQEKDIALWDRGGGSARRTNYLSI